MRFSNYELHLIASRIKKLRCFLRELWTINMWKKRSTKMTMMIKESVILPINISKRQIVSSTVKAWRPSLIVSETHKIFWTWITWKSGWGLWRMKKGKTGRCCGIGIPLLMLDVVIMKENTKQPAKPTSQ